MGNRSAGMRWMVVAVLTLWVSLIPVHWLNAQASQAADKSEAAKMLIVKVSGENAFGAGIIFSVRGGYLFITTAYHVIRGCQRRKLTVEFEFLRGIPIPVDVIHTYPKLDVAVLRADVQHTQFSTVQVRLPFDLIRGAGSLTRGDAVYPIGHPEGEEWDAPINPSRVKKVIAEEIHFQPACFPGHSGGGLFTAQWYLVGMVLRTRASSCEAVSFERIRATLEEDWGLKVNQESFTFTPVNPPATPTPTADAQAQARAQRIARLLKQADAYFERQWYITPEQTSALPVYLDVLTLDPENVRALQQIEKIAQFYKSRAERELQKGRRARALTYYQQYLLIKPNDDAVLDAIAELRVPPTPRPAATPTQRPTATPTPVPTAAPRSCWDQHSVGATCQEPVTGMEFVYVPAGCFQMGCVSGIDCYDNELPVHEVCLDGFWMGKYEVTNAQYRRWKRSHDSQEYGGHSLNGETQPAVNVSWEDARAFTEWLTQQYDRKYTFRLPSEAQWEYAARAGTATQFYFGNDGRRLGDYAWYAGNSAGRTHPVGRLKPNAWGLYDMLGNAWEWCQDSWHGDYHGAPTDGSAWESDDKRLFRLLRGGSWISRPQNCRCAFRDRLNLDDWFNFRGFRVVVVLVERAS